MDCVVGTAPDCSAARRSGRAKFTRSLRGFLVFGVLIVMSLAGFAGGNTASAQELQALLDRIERLERDIRTLNTQLSRGTAPAALESGEAGVTSGSSEMTGAAVARFDTRMTALEEDVRAATGAMEQVDYRIRTIEGQFEKIVSDMEFRLSELEQGRGQEISQGQAQGQVQGATGSLTGQEMTAVPSAAPVTQDVKQTESGFLGTITETELQNISGAAEVVGQTDTGTDETQPATQSVTTAPAEATLVEPTAVQATGPTPKEQYTNAFGLLRQAKYDEAAIALKAFIEQNPDDQLTPNARYWLGETYYVRSEFVSAAEAFFEGYKLAPTAAKAPDTLLKLGMALGNLDKKVEACAAFGKLADEFPNASANVRTTLERERLRNGC